MEDIPKSIIVILLILTVVISVLGTWTVLDEIEKSKMKIVEVGQNGQVRLNILPNPTEKSKQESFASGKVSLKILEAE